MVQAHSRGRRLPCDYRLVRMVVGLDVGSRWEDVAAGLRALGARNVTPPPASLPDVLVCDFDDAPTDELVAKLVEQDGVRYAEPDALQSDF